MRGSDDGQYVHASDFDRLARVARFNKGAMKRAGRLVAKVLAELAEKNAEIETKRAEIAKLRRSKRAWKRADREFPGLAACLIQTGRRVERDGKSAAEAVFLANTTWMIMRDSEFQTPPGAAVRMAQQAFDAMKNPTKS